MVHQVPRSFVVLASVHEHAKLAHDSFRNVQPIKLRMHNSRQAIITFPGVTENTCRSIQHSLQSVCNSLRRPGKNRISWRGIRYLLLPELEKGRHRQLSSASFDSTNRGLTEPSSEADTCTVQLNDDLRSALDIFVPTRRRIHDVKVDLSSDG